ncbi:hypothetical protein H257_11447 [Aphanomyces astaci]|uniref:CFA20 domain-containing protein n=1 Tax=Aphanomyces astaci TaxID=112090 RepID=W4G477_APHAT|nr:hypothetical protein H257_11447 [Aphanomyces astaci]ETV73753.1 hypothetical protein H257_11447 [Aphanomyces astaci]RHY19294.1 hypothetical protein DYB25_000328 [Aphanomyces astaci]RHY36830.1 hypothetical protein DYB34_000397 [Aphanomyces astaci]RHY53640.1 hypothetical protein DYB38_000086 [Aphanomyces astaci]RHY76318.1 hypothetical protein DYB30_000363 [Aphanomyces astaci]|eukprot:XP_009836689.1 hypothetical protein H257_11447 [Aphanomyces astaci]
MTAIELEELEDKLVEPLLPSPPSDTGDLIPLELHPAVLLADDECQQVGGDNIVQVVEDADVHQPVVEIRGSDARVVFNCHNVMQFLVLFVKNLDAYFALDIEVVDDTKTYRTFHITNSRSLARVQASACQMPLVFGKGGTWRHVCLDVHRMCLDAFGTHHVATVQVTVHATCRLLRVFFQDVDYSDAELPPMLALLD